MSESGDRNAPSKKESKDGSSKKEGKDASSKKDGKEDPLKKNLWPVALAGSAFIVLLGFAVMGVSVQAKMAATRYMEFIDGYDNGEFLVVLAVLGFVSALVGVYGTAVTFLSMTPEKYKRIRFLVLAYVGWGGGLVVLLLVSFWLTFSAVGSLELVFKPGFTASLVKYSKEDRIKISIDSLQRELECCGNYNHTEWFTVSWSDTVSKTETSIPESCCDMATVAAKRIQCISSAPFGETIRLTTYQTGCVKALVGYYGKALNMRAAMLIGIAIIEGGVVGMIMLEMQKAHKAEEAEKAKAETKELLEKKTGKKASKESVGEKAAESAVPPETPAMPAGPYPPGYGAVPGQGGPPPNMYYGGR